MEENARNDEDRELSLALDLQLDRKPICGRLRSTHGVEERFEGWLGFVDALERLRRKCPRDAASNDPEEK